MTEVEAVASRLRVEIPITIEQRIAGADKVGEHKGPILRRIWRRAVHCNWAPMGAGVELGERMGTGVPHRRMVYSFARLLETASESRRATV